MCLNRRRSLSERPQAQPKAASGRALSRRLRTCDLFGGPVARTMQKISYGGYRFPPEIIHQAIWLYLRFTLSFRDVEDPLSERGIAVSYETVRRWVNHFGPMIAVDCANGAQSLT